MLRLAFFVLALFRTVHVASGLFHNRLSSHAPAIEALVQDAEFLEGQAFDSHVMRLLEKAVELDGRHPIALFKPLTSDGTNAAADTALSLFQRAEMDAFLQGTLANDTDPAMQARDRLLSWHVAVERAANALGAVDQAASALAPSSVMYDTMRPAAVGKLPQWGAPEEPFFLHIAKNAGTSIEMAGLRRGMRWGSAHKSSFVRMQDGGRCAWHHVPPADFAELGLKNPYVNRSVFCIVRHPYDRVVSRYKFGIQTPYTWQGGLPQKNACTPDGLNTHMRSLAYHYSKRRSVGGCPHIPQSYYIFGSPGSGQQWCQSILNMTDLPQAFDNLMDKFHVDPKPKLRRENPSTDDGCPDLSVSDLDATSRKIIDEIAAEDFRQLGFSRY